MSLVGKKEICVPMQKLINYEVLEKKNASAKLKRLLKQHGFNKEVDFNLFHKEVVRKNGSIVEKFEYTLTPEAFKVCLIRSRNNYNKNEDLKSENEEESEDEKNKNKYAKYYLHLEECVEYYNNYQLQSKQSEINRLINQLEVSNKDNKEQTKELKLSNKKLDKLEEQNNKLLEELREVKQTLYIKSHDRATKVSKPQLNDVLILMRNELIKNDYCSLRTQKKSINAAIKDKNKNGKYTVILEFLFNPNSITHNNEVKIRLKEMRIANIYYNNITLNDNFYTEEDLKDIYTKIYEERIINMI